MKPSLSALSLVGLALAGLWYAAGGANPLPATRADDASARVAAPLAHENLSVYFVYGPDAVPGAKVMSLGEALERDLAVVHETSEVNTLAIENRSPDYELFVQSGDIVKGGKQDRMAQADMLLPPMSGVVAMKAHCVEQGRWTGRGTEDAKQFKSSGKYAVGNEMKIANLSGQQPAVWQSVSHNQTNLTANLRTPVNAAESPTSFQLTLEAPALAAKVAEYEAALKAAGEDRAGVVGVVFVVNGKVTAAEVYGSAALFRKAWPKLLNAAATEAVGTRDKPATDPPSAREVERFLAYGANEEPAESDPPGGQLIASFARRAPRGQTTMGNFEAVPNDDPAVLALQEIQRAHRRGGTVARETFFLNGLANAEEAVQTEGRGPGGVFQTEGRALATPDRVGRIMIEGNTVTGNRVATNPPGFIPAAAQQPPPPANPDGNRLSSNRQENRATLMVESRDPARQNAVIHRSYLKK